jgi:hypothetical protein
VLLLMFLAVQVKDGYSRAWLVELLLGHEAGEAARSKLRAQWMEEREHRIASRISENWAAVANSTAVVMFFDHGAYHSSVMRIGDIARPETLNLIATDYRCGYCRAEEPLVRDMMRANPGRKFIFLEAAILGNRSREFAAVALGAAKLGNYATAHQALFELSSGSMTDAIGRLAAAIGTDRATLIAASKDAGSVLEQHIALAALLQITVTPTYVIQGVPRIGTLRERSPRTAFEGKVGLRIGNRPTVDVERRVFDGAAAFGKRRTCMV